MNDYMGEFDVTEEHEFEPKELALRFIYQYGQIDGDHHKSWVLDQVTRILNGASYTVKEARWENGHKELRISVGSSQTYEEWVKNYMEEDGDPNAYSYDVGIPP